ncbi:hypothetical protein Pla22_10960 [Rubripirellula amarantea]|uniref:Tetratricopeptide repeat protein n=1 Tax=Rubripirellula amarantea TaxID=2527999 RepID=A0A5C5WS85_9BACT|nr:hypothetical protein [Rubripirellula amarantea]TWT53467.1 hypothetical protein Pla22_10960 [Rubripirellula amarantea]
MKKLALTFLTVALAVPMIVSGPEAQGQNAILSNLYGQGVHATYAGKYQDAYDYLSMAINSGSKDPRVYYFRGIVADRMGRPYESESDWQQGAVLEAQGKIVGSIGRALSRFQGQGRMKLEAIRQKAKLQYLAESAMRSQQRFGEIQAAEGDVLRAAPSRPAPPPAPPIAGDDNPFGDDTSEPEVEADDALEGAMDDPFGDAPAGTAPADAGDAFDADAPAADDPFGGSGDSPAGDDDPFGGSSDDPFGGSDDDPFGS